MTFAALLLLTVLFRVPPPLSSPFFSFLSLFHSFSLSLFSLRSTDTKYAEYYEFMKLEEEFNLSSCTLVFRSIILSSFFFPLASSICWSPAFFFFFLDGEVRKKNFPYVCTGDLIVSPFPIYEMCSRAAFRLLRRHFRQTRSIVCCIFHALRHR